MDYFHPKVSFVTLTEMKCPFHSEFIYVVYTQTGGTLRKKIKFNVSWHMGL